MKTNTQDYMDRMYNAIGTTLIDGNPIYGDRDGHLRLAREIGYALNDFTEAEQREILTSSYGTIYVRACRLKPILDAKEWTAEMRKGAGE